MTKLSLTFGFLALTLCSCNAVVIRQKRGIFDDIANKAEELVGAAGGAISTGLSYATIFPGTKWCGKGNIASHDDDLGTPSNTDACCRTHDKCPTSIETGQTNYGIHNNGVSTWVSCDCDDAFYSCLKGANNAATVAVGTAYFTILNNQCLYEDHPVTCKWRWWPPGEVCSQDTSAPKQWLTRKINRPYV